MVERPRYEEFLQRALSENPVVALLGPRQSGKTTLARAVASRNQPAHFFDLETASARTRLTEPETALGGLAGLVVIDEVQRVPALFQVLRPLSDRQGVPARFLLLGSASPGLVRGVSESLAGRIGFVDLGGFDLTEVGPESWGALWIRGGFPRSYLARSDSASLRWRRDFTRTFLERDVPQLGTRVPPETLRRFWMMLAHYHGQIWNGAELARALAVSEHRVREYLDLLAGTYLVRILPPWFENVGKRQYKAPKVYVRDSGLLHGLLGLGDATAVHSHPKVGASWEGFALEQVLAVAGSDDAYYWGTHAGAELDLLLLRQGRRFGVEFKFSDAPGLTKSLRIALDDLKLERAWVVYPGRESYSLHEKVEVVPITAIPKVFGFLSGDD